jgi:hypothetical protein
MRLRTASKFRLWRLERQARRSEKWRWRADLSTNALPVLGATTLALLRKPDRWVHRRVETFDFVDAGVVRRRLTVDFTLPPELPTPFTVDGKPLTLVPLTMIPRRPGLRGQGDGGPMHFDLRNNVGQALPLLTEREHSLLTAAALMLYAREVMEAWQAPWLVRELRGDLGAALSRIPYRSFAQNVAGLRELLNPRSPEWRASPLRAYPRSRLARDPDFCDFLALVAGNSVTMAPVIGGLGERQVIKLCYDQRLDPRSRVKASRRASALEWLGYAPKTATLDVPLAGGAEAQHFQLALPLNLELTQVAFSAWQAAELTRDSVYGEPLPEPAYREFIRGFDTRAHVYIPSARAQVSGTVQVGIRAERRGILTGTVVAGALVGGALIGYWRFADRAINGASTAGIAALLLAPGLVAAYLARPGEHAIVRRLLVFPRVVMATSAALTLIAAAMLQILVPRTKPTVITKVHDHFEQLTPRYTPSVGLKTGLGVLALISLVLFVLLLMSRILPRPGKPEATIR